MAGPFQRFQQTCPTGGCQNSPYPTTSYPAPQNAWPSAPAPYQHSPYSQLAVPAYTPSVSASQPVQAHNDQIPSVVNDPQAHLSSRDDGYQQLSTNLKRPAGVVTGTQKLSVIDNGQLQVLEFSIDAKGVITKKIGTTQTPVTDVKVLYCDELGVVRDKDGKETGKLAIPKSWASEVTPGNGKGIFLHSSNSEALQYFQKQGENYSGPVSYLDAGLQLANGEKVLFCIGKPPKAETSYTARDGMAQVTSVDRNKAGAAVDYSKAPLVQRERGVIANGAAVNLEKRFEEIAKALERKPEEMQTVQEKRDANGNVVQKYSMHLEYLTHRDPSSGQLSRNAVGVNSDGSLLMYVGSQGTKEEQEKGGGWRNLEKAGFKHLFVQKDFSVVDKSGETIGTIDVTSLDPEKLKLAQKDGAHTGIFLSQNAKIILTDGTIKDFNAETLSLGTDRAVLQLGSPANTKASPGASS
jgi:hypothetical protein